MNLHVTPSFSIDRLCQTASVLLFLVIGVLWFFAKSLAFRIFIPVHVVCCQGSVAELPRALCDYDAVQSGRRCHVRLLQHVRPHQIQTHHGVRPGMSGCQSLLLG